ncbi:MAG TPA: PfkB family carbohydrate kinase [Bryobacteraceae bacterium]|nr:PfkB family carbohydrate kinase [Bryobacteraceae bacterium]
MIPLDAILARFPEQRALVVGDICLDRWCGYDPAYAEPSRETGIPRIAVTRPESTPGAGGTIANNLVALGTGHVSVLGIFGDDGNAWELRRALSARGIEHGLCVTHPQICTFTYTKLLNIASGLEDQPRVDYINVDPIPPAAGQQVIRRLTEAVPDFDVILVSDQAETAAGGVITPAVRDRLAALAGQFPDKVFWVDSRLRAEHFRNVILKPNEDEAAAACARLRGETDYQQLRSRTQAPFLLVTHGPRGVLIVTESAETWVRTAPIAEPLDICGAGDSFSAGASIAYAISRDPVAAARLGNLVASITIMKKGTGTTTQQEIRQAAAALSIP